MEIIALFCTKVKRIMITDIKVNRPEPVFSDKPLKVFRQDTNVKFAIKALEAGNPIIVTELYNNGLILLNALNAHLNKKFRSDTFEQQSAQRAAYRKLSNLILLEVVHHQLVVSKAPTIGWLEKLYPETEDFLLPFPQVQGLNSAWQWYKNGISIPVLRNKLYPYYGTYFPTRFDHLVLFDNFLKHYTGAKKTAIDVGCGSGVLSLQMVQHGFQKVFGTDTNPNAVVGLTEFMGDTKLSRKIELDYAALFGKFEKQTELIVFNPPWLPATHDAGNLDSAIYYDENLFPDFFAAAKEHLLPDGKLVLLFSNLAHITHVTNEHPIKKEISRGGRFQLEKCYTKTVKAASDKTRRDLSRRDSEIVELWILTHK